MSISVEHIPEKFYFAFVHMLLAVGVILAVYLALSGHFGREAKQRLSLPVFTGMDFREDMPLKKQTDKIKALQLWYPKRDIFRADAVVYEQPETEPETAVDLEEISLELIIVKGAKRFCLTNGVLLGEGEGSINFTVISIEPDGVWYQVGDREIHLQVGGKIYLNAR